MLTHSNTDGGNLVSGYGEMTLSKRLSGFLLGVSAIGNERQEFSSLIGSMATAGIKVALP